jgi:hypothetical protein
MMIMSALIDLYSRKMRLANFAICQSCYWCASCFGIPMREDPFPKCLQCGSTQPLDIIPISDSEFFRTYFGESDGVALMFREESDSD